MGERNTKLNCREAKKCCRQPAGIFEKVLGTCPAIQEEKLGGVHDGTNAGRACRAIAGTLCKSKVQGSFAQKYKNCEACDLYRSVKSEEFSNFTLSKVLLSKKVT
jgi:hypothetical protein